MMKELSFNKNTVPAIKLQIDSDKVGDLSFKIEEGYKADVNTKNVSMNWWGYGTNSINHYTQELKQIVSFAPNIDITGKSLYFLSKCNVPRYKLEEIKIEKKVKVVRNSNKADYIVYSDSELNIWENIYRTCTVGNFRRSFLLKDHFSERNLQYAKDHLEKYSDETVIFFDNYYSVDQLYTNTKNFLQQTGYYNKLSVGEAAALRNWSHYFTDRCDENSSYNLIFKEKTLNDLLSSKLIHEKYFHETLSSTVIDETMYNQLSEMLRSTDASNHELALTLIGSCNFKKSLLYILLLYKKYPKLLYTKGFNSVNIKSLKAYVGTNLRHLDSSVIIKLLCSKKAFYKHYNEALVQDLLLTFIKNHGLDGYLDFDTSSIKVKDEFYAEDDSESSIFVPESNTEINESIHN